MPVGEGGVPGRDAPQRGPQPVDAAGIGRVADGATDIRPMPDRTDPRRRRRRRAARGSARRDPRIPGVARVPVQPVAAEPAQREGRRVGPPQDHRPRLAEIGDDRIVLGRAVVLLHPQAIRRGPARLVHIDLDGHRHARHRARILATRDGGIDARGLGQRLLRIVLHDGVDRRVGDGQSRQRIPRDTPRADLLGAHQGGDFGRGQAPELGHRVSFPRGA